MPRDFNGSSDQIVCATGSSNVAFGTLVTICRTDADGSAKTIFNVRDSAANRCLLQREATNLFSCRFSGAVVAPTIGLVNSDGWCLLAATKITGNNAPRFHKYSYSTGTWTHENAASSTNNANTSAVQLNIGHRNSDQRWDGEIALMAIFNTALADEQIENLAHSLNGYRLPSLVTLILLDQAATSQKVLDWTGNGANESSITGTAVGASSVPSFTYGAPVLPSLAVTAVTPSDKTITVPSPATALGIGPLPTPTISVTGQAIALGDGPPPTPSLSVTAVAIGLGDGPLPTPAISVTATAARAVSQYQQAWADNFNDNSLDTGLWVPISGVVEQNQRLEMPIAAATVDYVGVDATARPPLIGTRATYRIVQGPETSNGGSGALLYFFGDGTSPWWGIETDYTNPGGFVSSGYYDNHSSIQSVTTGVVAKQWQRVEITASLVRWLHSDDGVTWVEWSSFSTPASFASHTGMAEHATGTWDTTQGAVTGIVDDWTFESLFVPTPVITVTAGGIGLGVAPVSTIDIVEPNVTITAVPALAAGIGVVPTPSISVTAVATALGVAPPPVPSISVTAGAVALGDGPLPTPTVAVTAVAVALGIGPPPTVVLFDPNANVAAEPAVARGRSDFNTASVTVGPLACIAAARGPAHSVNIAEADQNVIAVVGIALGDGPLPTPGVAPAAVVADALGIGRVPSITAQLNIVVVSVVAIAYATAVPSSVLITCELDNDAAVMTTETATGVNVGTETLTATPVGTETLTGVTLGSETLTPLTIDPL